MTWLSIGKSTISLVTSIGISNIIGNIVKSTTPTGLNTFNKLSINIGVFVLSGMISDQASKYISHEIDDLISNVNKVTKEEKVGP